MDKLEMKTARISLENIEKIKTLFPNAVTEVIKDGKVELAVDFDVLKQELSDSLISEGQERYQMTWPDKKKAIALANSAIAATLRPCKEESVDFDNTQNLYIEGDNLDVLKLLRETYLGKVKMIYIDPPYNTGHDSFVYNDCYSMDEDKFLKAGGYYDEDGNRVIDVKENNESTGKFHTEWLNMIYPRLKVARDLLSDDGVIFISIDDNEQANLKKICDEIFGESNFVGQITVVGNPRGRDYGGVARMHDYLLVYQKSYETEISLINDTNGEFKLFDKLGGFELRELRNRNIKFNKENRPNLYYPFYINTENTDENGLYEISLEPKRGWIELYPLESQGVNTVWRWGKQKSAQNLNLNIAAKSMKNGGFMIVEKYRESKMMARSVWWDKDSNTEKGTLLVKELLEGKIFDYPKPIEMINRIIQMGSSQPDNDIILDFFSGSATTAHAVMQLNAEDGGSRKFIMVQLPEKCDEKSEAYKAGYKNICEIGKERIRRAGKKIKEELAKQKELYNSTLGAALGAKINGKTVKSVGQLEIGATERKDFELIDENGENSERQTMSSQAEKDKYKFNPDLLDIGFRVLKLDSSNMQDVYYNPSVMTQTLLDTTIDNVKSDRTPLDLLFQVMLELGVQLSAKIEEKKVNGKTYYAVNDNDIIACFDKNLDNDVITEIAKQQPLYAVFKDKSFATDSVGINNEQLFKTYSPATEVKVI